MTVSGNNGFRLNVDDQPLIDSWERLVDGEGLRSREVVVHLQSGVHKLQLEWYEWDEGASVSFSVDDPGVLAWCQAGDQVRDANGTAWEVQWYKTKALKAPTQTETFPATFDKSYYDETRAFVAKAELNVPGTKERFVEFGVGSDDGAMLLVDGQVVIDDWGGGSYSTTATASALLSPGKHNLKLRYWNQAALLGLGVARISFDVKPSDVLLWCE